MRYRSIILFSAILLNLPENVYNVHICADNLLACPVEDDLCLPTSNRCDGEIDCTSTREDEEGCPPDSQTFCPDNFTQVIGANEAYCYKLKPTEDGPMWFPECLEYCLNQSAFIARPNSVAQVAALADWLDRPGKGKKPIEGYWGGWMRQRAPLINGVLTPNNRDIRKDPNGFHDIYSQCPRVRIQNIFRTPSQPGEKEDQRDERCVAKKQPNNGRFEGVDDYTCSDNQKHFCICEKCLEIEESQV